VGEMSGIGRHCNVDCKEVKWEGLEGIVVGQYRDRRWAVVNVVMNLQVA